MGIEQQMMDLAREVARATGEKEYAIAKVEANINGDIEWNCYTPASAWSSGATFGEALEKQTSRTAIAAKLREKARKMLAEADALVKEDQ